MEQVRVAQALADDFSDYCRRLSRTQTSNQSGQTGQTGQKGQKGQQELKPATISDVEQAFRDARVMFAPYLLPKPTFVVTSRGLSKRMEMWAATVTSQIIPIDYFAQHNAADEFTRKGLKQAYELAASIDDDWLLAPISILLLRSRGLSAKLFEVQTQTQLPVLQFMKHRKREFKNISSHVESNGRRTL